MHNLRPIRARARGYSLIEVMVAIAVAVFLLAGIVMIESNTKKTSIAQTGLEQLQDEERIAMTILSNVIQQAGYYPIPTGEMDKHQLLISLPAVGSMVDGQAIYGQKDANENDILTIRFLTNPGDGVLNCQGSSNTGTGQQEYDNEFSVNADNQLVCKVNSGNAIVLVNNITSFKIQYGVFSSTVTQFDNGGGVDTYIDATQFALEATTPPAFWTNVYTVKITIGFVNPLKGQPGQDKDTIYFTRIISLKSRTGVNV